MSQVKSFTAPEGFVKAHTHSLSLKLLNSLLAKVVKRGTLVIIDAAGIAHEHGDGDEPRAVVRLTDPRIYSAVFLNPELAVGEAYMAGTLRYDGGSIRDLLRIFHINKQNLRRRPLRRMIASGLRNFRRLQQHNSIAKARENVAHHYDLSNSFYKLFLDTDLNYSCAYFTESDQSLEEAQMAKKRHIAAKLRIEPGMRVLDIGSGWGGMAFYLAEHLGAEVVGVTLSEAQQKLATERAREKGLDDKVDFRLLDYRQVEERFDRIVSVGMFEHVGVPFYNEFFNKIDDLLADDGVALLHAIGRRGPPATTGPWIRKYIFPGGYSPSLSETFAAIERSALWVSDVEILRMHYAATLREWHRRFQDNREKVRAMFDERFCRMWEFFLSTSEFAFRYGGLMVFQIQLTKHVASTPFKRDYMLDAERALMKND